MSVSSGLSVALPKYFLPAALATSARPALDVPVGKATDDVAVPDDVDVDVAVVEPELLWRHCEYQGLLYVQVQPAMQVCIQSLSK